MTRIKYLLAWIIGLIFRKILMLFPQFGGNAAPGLIALKIDNNFLVRQKNNFSFHIVISGTNGKTTTARMVSAILKKDQHIFIHNRSGSNLLRGLVSAIIAGKKKLKKKPIGLWEVDEAVLPKAIHQLKPKIIIITNLFRDQLDRYGEIDILANKWLTALKNTNKKAKIILNGNDASLINLGRKLKNKIIFFGLETKKSKLNQINHSADATFCPLCLKPLAYTQVYFSHLGNFSCSCGFCQPAKIIKAVSIKTGNNKTLIRLNYSEKKLSLKLNITGLFNVYNALAAISTAFALNFDLKKSVKALEKFTPAFGRMETIKTKNKTIKLILVKNPTGFNQAINSVANLNYSLMLLALNDKLADGTDVSWIWDVNFEKLAKLKTKFIISGDRAGDLALRLKYAGIRQKRIILISNDLKTCLEKIFKSRAKKVCLLPTYTAMLSVRRLLKNKGLVKSIWED